jgi:hypothetical protein
VGGRHRRCPEGPPCGAVGYVVLRKAAGSLLALLAAALILGGGALLAAHLTQRDDDGFCTSPTTRLATGTYAADRRAHRSRRRPRQHRGLVGRVLDATTRVRVDPAGDAPLFVGIAREADVDAYLRGVAHDQVQDVGARHGDLTARYDRVPGAGTPQPPGSERFWVASSSGVGTQTLRWKPRSGRWSVVVMRADAARGVAADVKVGVRLNLLLWIGIGLLSAGVLAGPGGWATTRGPRSAPIAIRRSPWRRTPATPPTWTSRTPSGCRA